MWSLMSKDERNVEIFPHIGMWAQYLYFNEDWLLGVLRIT